MSIKPKLRTKRTDQSLIHAAKHVEYEIAMLVYASTTWARNIRRPPRH